MVANLAPTYLSKNNIINRTPPFPSASPPERTLLYSRQLAFKTREWFRMFRNRCNTDQEPCCVANLCNCQFPLRPLAHVDPYRKGTEGSLVTEIGQAAFLVNRAVSGLVRACVHFRFPTVDDLTPRIQLFGFRGYFAPETFFIRCIGII